MKISFVIAVYNNHGSIKKTYETIKEVFENKLTEYNYEVVFVNDGSKDESWKEIEEIVELDSQVKGLSFTRNFGQMSAMLAGFKEATGDAIINISADLQDPISLVPEMIEKWQSGSKIVICYRIAREDTLSSKMLSKIGYSLLRISSPEIPSGGFDYVLMDRVVMDAFNDVDVRHRFFQGDLLWTGYSTSFIPYERLKRTIGKSQYNFGKKLKNFLDAFLDSSYIPIRMITVAGIITFISGLLYSMTILISWLFDKTPFEGWAPLMIIILLVGGMTMFSLGIVGEYIWRIYEEVRKRPNYIIKEKI
ncbi:glycosyltransferase family 2 protein [Aliarcobacter cryaerophilus]|uniref:glycosyltransferase family 2 protein n=1 Tax=Aliarcobacter cryaerophilus TaxID=28198 RepID=UPI0021B2314F|nr:glycosyltransferase family 2 protein [Aliarcobacter cryaerophilus]MCT7501835.1 glycosyltransferase family 2 protein [Aliarcobacter cryaerophilus]